MLGGFNLNGHFRVADNGIHLFFVVGVPIGNDVPLVVVSFVCNDFLHHKMFKSVPVIICASFQRVTTHQVVGKSNIKIVEPRGLNNLPLDFFPERWDFVPDKRIVKDLEVRLDRFGRNAAIGGDVGIVQHFSVRNGGNLHETFKRIEFPHFAFFPDFFVQIHFYIAGKSLSSILYHIVAR